MSRRIPLSDPDLEAAILQLKSGNPGLLFTCPVCTGNQAGHGHLIAFHDGPSGRQPDGTVFWHRESGAGLEDLTLAPSYLTECMHAYVRAGHLEIL